MLFLYTKKKVSFNFQELKAHRKKIRLINLNKYNRASRTHNTPHCNSHSKSKNGMKTVEKHKTENSKRF